MTTTQTSLTAALYCALAICLGLSLGPEARGDDDTIGGYGVPKDRHTNKDHEGALIVVSKKDGKFGLFFMEMMGQYKGMPISCTDTTHYPNNKIECEKFVIDKGKAIKEKITVGRLNGEFCKAMRQDHNLGQDKPIYEINECPNDKTCVCYQIEHKCWDGKGYAGECTTTKLVGSEMTEEAYAPPGNGAGSGGSH